MKDIYLQSIYILGEHKRKLVGMLVFFIGSSVLDLLGIGLIGPFIALIANPDEFASNGFWSNAMKYLGINNNNNALIYLGLIIISIFYIKNIIAYLIQKEIIKFRCEIEVVIRDKLMSAYMSMPYVFHLQRNSANLINTMQLHVGQFSKGVLANTLKISSELIALVVIVSFLVYTSPWATLAIIGIFSIMIVIYDTKVRDKMVFWGKVSAEKNAEMIKNIKQGIGGIKEIRVIGKEAYFSEQTYKSACDVAQAKAGANALDILPRYIIESLMVSFVIGLTVMFIWQDKNPASVFPILGVFAMAAIRLMPSANSLINGMNSLRYSKQFVSQLYGDLKELDGSRPYKLSTIPDNNTSNTFEVLEVSNVSYRYPGAGEDALSDISFTLLRGQSIGIIGQSGSGKTSLVDVLLGLLQPTAGSINVNGISIFEDMKRWREHTAYIPQDGFIIDDTLKRNVALGVDDNLIDNSHLAHSLELAQMTSVVSGLPEGMETVLGEHGVRLSGGQKQRVALARAFYHNRDLIVMDEATSALDTDTEKEIITAINSIRGENTLIVIAHRLSTVQDCDFIIRLDKGRIVDSGLYSDVVGVD